MLSVYSESFTSEFAETGLQPEWTGSFGVQGVSGEEDDSMVTVTWRWRERQQAQELEEGR